jgi:APA family basic amino acid/polyamine antiporter
VETPGSRHIGLFGATVIGVGAIVGGGILALAGVAFRTAGPAALLAFVLNGGIAFLTAASFAELAVRFPQSGGTYTYAKRVLSIEVAFVVGWVVWFASIVAGVLYALGFAVFAAEGATRLLAGLGRDAAWLSRGELRVGFALAAVGFYTVALVRKAGGGGNAATIGKVVVFVTLIVGGVVAAFGQSGAELAAGLQPFLPTGPGGLFQAMGYTFIALQGFDLIAAVGGEVRDPERNLPRAMYLSLAIALVIYVPLLLLITTVGVPAGMEIAEVAAANPEGLVAEAAERFLGPVGYWLVIGAGVLSMLSALQANLLGASRVAFSMARDRTLPRPLGRMSGATATPALAVVATAVMLAIVVAAVGDVSAAGAASSLIFLISFAMVHWAAILARRRSGDRRLPVVPLLGAALCLGLGVFQAFSVPAAGKVVMGWLLIGLAFFVTLLARGARLADTSAEARDPDLARLRGRSPLVLVPIASPASAAGLVGVAATVRTPSVGRVLQLSVVTAPEEVPDEDHPVMRDAETILGESLLRGFERATPAETLFTIAADPALEIARVARLHRCETVVLGAPRAETPDGWGKLEAMVSPLDADVVIVRAPRRWRIAQVRRVLVPIGGRGDHSRARARLLASLTRSDECAITFLRTLPPGLPDGQARQARREVQALARDEVEGRFEVAVEEVEDPCAVILRHAAESDLVVLGLQHARGTGRVFGRIVREVAESSDVPLILIGARGHPRR